MTNIEITRDTFKDGCIKLYQELLYSVSRKFPNESRHETALRYIIEAEQDENIQEKQLEAYIPARNTIDNFKAKIAKIKEDTK